VLFPATGGIEEYNLESCAKQKGH